MRPAGHHRIVQIHPTLRCNLRCSHCYSSSGPDRAEALPLEALSSAVTDARHLGYDVVGLSGGEPLLYEHLHALLGHAHGLGMVTTVTTNGMMLDAPRLSRLQGLVSLIAISIDGIPESHNRIRNHPRAFSQMKSNLEYVRASEIPFGFIFTLTQHNVDELDWVARFALEQGAGLLQIHPLEEVGRAASKMIGATPDATEAAFAYLEALRIQAAVGEQLIVQLDVAHRDRLDAAVTRRTDSSEVLLSEVLSPIVIEADGWVVPLQYGFPRSFAIGNCLDVNLRDAAMRWLRDVYPSFGKVCDETLAHLRAQEGLPLVNLYEAVTEQAARTTPSSRTSARTEVATAS